ncbi:hypothetical protein ACQZV8_20065, partial [Magnetococcales bacterium HHB-1]
MARRRRKKKTAITKTPEQQLKTAQKALENGDYRQAINLLKNLQKKTPSEQIDKLLGKSYLNRAKQLATKQLFQEASLTLNKAKALGKEVPIDLQLICSVNSDEWSIAAPLFIEQENQLKKEHTSLWQNIRELLSLQMLFDNTHPWDKWLDKGWIDQCQIAQTAL